MPSRIVQRNRVVWRSLDFPRKQPDGVPRNKEGEILDCTTGIPANSPKSPYRAGTALYDREEDVAYRCVESVNPLEGWATTEFWQRRWNVDHKAVCIFVRAGMLDAVLERSSQVKRYRCRDEWTLKQSSLWKKERRRMAVKRHNAKRARRMTLRMRAELERSRG